jgi:dihydrofolate synthase/folylpolyglutamate synthase
VADELVVTANTSPRAMAPQRLAELAIEVFGEARVHLEPELPEAIVTAVGLAESDVDGGLSGVGVLVTGSVITVADARKLLRR